MENLPPYSEQAEQALLGSILNNWINECRLFPYMFYFDKHKRIFEAMTELVEIDILTVAEKVWDLEWWTLAILAEISTSVPTWSHWQSYEKIIYEKWQCRAYLTIAQDLCNVASDCNFSEIKNQLNRFNKIMPYQEVEKELHYKKPFTWWTVELDKYISPIEQYQMLVLAGETWIWKTCFTFDMAIKNAQLGHKVLYISLEMSTEAIIRRTAREFAGIRKYDWRNRWENLSGIDKNRRTAFIEKQQEIESIKWFVPLWLDNVSMGQILSEIELHNPDLVFIDNIWMIEKGSEVKDESKLSREVQNFCKTKHIPIILLHHFRKAHNTKKTLRSLDDFRGSSQFGNDCATAIQVWRDIDKKDWIMRVVQMKDREFGTCWSVDVKFQSGTFLDRNLIDEAKDIF